MDSQFHVIVSDHLHPTGWHTLRQAAGVRLSGPYVSRLELLDAVGDADALIIRSSTLVDQDLFDQAHRLKVVARAGAQIENIDIDTATKRGIMVINVPDANVVAVVEHTFAMLLALARHIPNGATAIHEGKWPRHELLGFQLQGKQLGLIGFGRLGKEVATRAQSFGMSVLVYDPYVDLAFAHAQGIEVLNFADLLARADIISLHTAYTPMTHELMNAEAFQQMKPGAYFINCVHAGLVNETDLFDALERGHLAGAALDTLSHEPPAADDPLLNHPNVLVVPHLNQNTVESQIATSRQVAKDVISALFEEDYRHVVNLPFSEDATYRDAKPYLHLATKLGKLQRQVAEGPITRVEIELLGEGTRNLVRPIAAALLSGMLRLGKSPTPNWVSAPVTAYEQGIQIAQAKGLVSLADYPNLIACRVFWDGQGSASEKNGHRTVAGVLFGNGEARLVQYERFNVDAYPEGYVVILENEDVPGVIGKVGTRLGRAGINIAQWRYGRDHPGGKAVSFINLDHQISEELLVELENETDIKRARLVYL